MIDYREVLVAKHARWQQHMRDRGLDPDDENVKRLAILGSQNELRRQTATLCERPTWLSKLRDRLLR